MRKKLFMILIFLLVINDYVYGKNVNNTKSIKLFHKNTKQKETKSRTRRSLDEDFEKLFSSAKEPPHYGHIVEGRGQVVKIQPIIDKELPFWGARGRRDSSEEVIPNVELPAYNYQKHFQKINNLHRLYINYEDKLRKDEDSPFWGNRGRRDSDESDENDVNLFWANRGRRQDDEPFWGTRGRRENILRLWGGRRDDDEPFWGNRGRRQEQEPFWGNRGRREKDDNFGINKAKGIYIKNTVDDPFDVNKNKFEIKLKDSIIESINHIQHKLGKLERNKRDETRLPFWDNRGRDSKLMSLFNGKIRNRLHYVLTDQNKAAKNELRSKTFEPNTVHDDRIFAEEPRYILVERSSRSSAEDDPFFISRGKKYSDYDLDNGTRGRRGSIEELVKSVRNDPYYIARGKKKSDKAKPGNSTKDDDFTKAKELICSTADVLISKIHGNKVKREINDNERNRRTILKKLALQLQMDPYFVSRGKKSDNSVEKTNSEDFINSIVTMCN